MQDAVFCENIIYSGLVGENKIMMISALIGIEKHRLESCQNYTALTVNKNKNNKIENRMKITHVSSLI